MNHCHDCNSDYAAPGTCNCFAPGGKRAAAPLSAGGTTTIRIPVSPTDGTLPWSPLPWSTTNRCPSCGASVGMFEYHPCTAPRYTLTCDAPV